MDKQTRRNFLTCVAGAAAGLLVGSTFKEEWVYGCCPLKPFIDCGDDANVFVNGEMVQYAVVRIDTNKKHYSFSTFSTTWKDGIIEEGFSGGICGKDLSLLTKFEENAQKDDENYKNRYLIINNNEEYGFLATCNPCWNFRASV